MWGDSFEKLSFHEFFYVQDCKNNFCQNRERLFELKVIIKLCLTRTKCYQIKKFDHHAITGLIENFIQNYFRKYLKYLTIGLTVYFHVLIKLTLLENFKNI